MALLYAPEGFLGKHGRRLTKRLAERLQRALHNPLWACTVGSGKAIIRWANRILKFDFRKIRGLGRDNSLCGVEGCA